MKEKKKNMHVLDWGEIAKDSIKKQSANFADSNGARMPNKGILFEDVIERLLGAMFPEETWKRTGESHDGKRDFVYPAEEYLKEQKWAECKNYNSNLSINVIAPTLIMGAIKGIECIFFFSYSPLNDTAIEDLLRYSEGEQSVIKIYDGNLLESLICKYHSTNGIDTFFPNTDFEKARAELEKTPLRIIKSLWDLNGNKIPSTHQFELGESFYYHVAVQNLSWRPVNCEVSFRVNNQKVLRCVGNSYEETFPFAEIKGYSVLCEALGSGNTRCISKVTANGTSKVVYAAISVIDEPYLAWSGDNALKAQECGKVHLENREKQPLLIVGQSGTGKSTLAEILLHQEQIQKSYRVLKVDLALARNVCMRNLLSQIFGMRGKEETPKDQTVDDETALSLLVNSYAESAALIAQTMIKFYKSDQPYLFVIDDVQKITRPYISLIQELDDLSRRNNCPVYYLFTLNEDETSTDELLSRLNWDKNYQNRECNVIRTTKFGKKDILTYLKTRYGLENIDSFFDGFEKEISPLDLRIFCIGLQKEHVIAKIPGEKTYQIINPFRFSDGIEQVLYSEIPLTNIIKKIDKGDQAEFLLKYLYISGTFTPKTVSRNKIFIHNLVAQGILREKDGLINFYHDKIRSVIGKTLVFSEEDYADIFSDSEADDAAKAICALEQIGRLRNGSKFLKYFFASDGGIKKGEQRHQICRLIFQHLSDLSATGLFTDALRFVKSQFPLLREEQGHDTFFAFLKHVADSALAGDWDINEECIENIAFLIKKFFDRALSTHNDQICLNYFIEFEKIFKRLKHISEGNRNFWLAHYANRAAISMDRKSVPFKQESAEAKNLYDLSEFYSRQAGNQNQLVLQITVDNFNRHYVYQHNLTPSIISNTLIALDSLKDNGMTSSPVLEYHLLLLKYLNSHEDRQHLEELLQQVIRTREKSGSSFYIMKLYLLEITVLSNLGAWNEAEKTLSKALAFAYKKEMRQYVYKLTYIKAQLILFSENHMFLPELYRQAILALEQMIDTQGKMIQNLKREAFLLVQLMRIITCSKLNNISEMVSNYSMENQSLLNTVFSYVQGDPTDMDDLLGMESFFVVEGVSFPTI